MKGEGAVELCLAWSIDVSKRWGFWHRTNADEGLRL